MWGRKLSALITFGDGAHQICVSVCVREGEREAGMDGFALPKRERERERAVYEWWFRNLSVLPFLSLYLRLLLPYEGCLWRW